MTTRQRNIRRSGVRVARKIGLMALMALPAIALFAVLTGPLSPPRKAVYAAYSASSQRANEPWLMINCLETQVKEGEDFRLEVQKKYASAWPHETMRVFWYTQAITADESDYERLYAERQSSNEYQSEHGRMGRDFHTKDDLYPEADETFRVRFNNSVDRGTDGECIITIKDDDGVGIYKLEITSAPEELPAASVDGETPGAYTLGDAIEITARFTGDVTDVNPDTGERADYAGLYIQVGENRRVASLLRGEGTDRLVFGYTVQGDDLDADGISVEAGGPGTGLYYNEDSRDGGLWSVDTLGGRINRIFHGLDDDPDHAVLQPEIEEPTITQRPTETDVPVEPAPELPVENSIVLDVGSGLIDTRHGELTAEDDGRDWFSFNSVGGQNYILELKNRMEFSQSANSWLGLHMEYVPGHLVDPSILEILDEEGERVLGERDQGGFMGNFARAFFIPEEDGTYYVAVGGGNEYRVGLGHYTLSVRVDDHADDYRPDPDVALRPGDSITARIDSDVAPDHPGLNPWDWAVTEGGVSIPVFGVESLDDRDVFRLEISEEGEYRVAVSDGPAGVSIWSLFDDEQGLFIGRDTTPVEEIVHTFLPGAYHVEIGTPYESEGNAGSYTVSLSQVAEDQSAGDSAA